MKKSFTLLELIFVVVVIGILAAVIIPKTKTHPLEEAALQLLSHIRYTQHLALINDKYSATDAQWYKKRWQLMFGKNTSSNGEWAYTIFSDTSGKSTGDANELEIAINPQNPNQRMTGGYTGAKTLDINNANFIGMKKLNLGVSYSVTDIESSCGQRISFDYVGRPMRGDQSTLKGSYIAGTTRLLYKDCVLVLKKDKEKITLIISKETGYTKILF